jgi:hypothetical protein
VNGVKDVLERVLAAGLARMAVPGFDIVNRNSDCIPGEDKGIPNLNAQTVAVEVPSVPGPHNNEHHEGNGHEGKKHTCRCKRPRHREYFGI